MPSRLLSARAKLSKLNWQRANRRKKGAKPRILSTYKTDYPLIIKDPSQDMLLTTAMVNLFLASQIGIYLYKKPYTGFKKDIPCIILPRTHLTKLFKLSDVLKKLAYFKDYPKNISPRIKTVIAIIRSNFP